MAKRQVVTMTDDLDGSDAATTLSFSWEGVQYEIDLSQANADKLGAALAPYVGAARRVGGRGSRAGGAKRATKDSGVVRAWAAAKGIEVSTRGRIPAAVQKQYDDAH